MRKIPFAGIELTSQRVRGLRGTSELPWRPAFIDLSNTNPACGHKEVPKSTCHIVVTTRHSDQQGSKSRQNMDARAEVTQQEDDHIVFFFFFFCLRLLSAVVPVLLFLARWTQPSLSLVDREVSQSCFVYPRQNNHSPLVGHDVRNNFSSCDCAEIRTDARPSSSEGFEIVTN